MDFFTTNFAVNMTEADFSHYWDEMKERMLYLEDFDAFYLVHGDTMMAGYDLDRAVWNDDYTVSVYYTGSPWYLNESGELDILWDQPMCALLMPVEADGLVQGWKALSNTIVE